MPSPPQCKHHPSIQWYLFFPLPLPSWMGIEPIQDGNGNDTNNAVVVAVWTSLFEISSLVSFRDYVSSLYFIRYLDFYAVDPCNSSKNNIFSLLFLWIYITCFQMTFKEAIYSSPILNSWEMFDCRRCEMEYNSPWRNDISLFNTGIRIFEMMRWQFQRHCTCVGFYYRN